MNKLASAIAAIAMTMTAASPALAAGKSATPPAQALSLKNAVRASTPTSAKSQRIAGENPTVSVLLAAVVIGGVIVASAVADNGDSGDSN